MPPSSGIPPPPPHGSVHVVPAGQLAVFPPLQVMVQASVPPHTTVQPLLPAHAAVQPPLGQVMLHELLPVHETVEPVSTVTWQLLPPPQVTVLLVPVETVQSLVPLHVVVQFEPHVPLHVDCPSHVVVQPVPHEESHVFLDWQSKVALFGGATPPSVPPSPATPPKLQVPPALQVHVPPVQVQSPVHVAAESGTEALLPPHPEGSATKTAIAVSDPRIQVERMFAMWHLTHAVCRTRAVAG